MQNGSEKACEADRMHRKMHAEWFFLAIHEFLCYNTVYLPKKGTGFIEILMNSGESAYKTRRVIDHASDD